MSVISEETITWFLPSSSKSFGNENTLSDYTCQLQNQINLDPSNEWQVGLSQLFYPRSAMNVKNCFISYYSFIFNSEMLSRIGDGEYSTIDEVVDALNQVVYTDKEYYKFTANKEAYRLMLEMAAPKKSDVESDTSSIAPAKVPYIKINTKMQMLTGFQETVSGVGYHIGEYTWSLFGNVQSIYVYCPGMVKPTVVGDTMAPLLAVCSYDSAGIFGTENVFEPKTIQYQPVSSKTFSSVTVQLRNKLGELIPFSGGSLEVLLVVSFRKRPRYE